MKTVLAQARANNLSQVSKRPLELEGCDQYHNQDYQGQLNANEVFCVDARNTVFVALGDSLRIEGQSQSDRTPIPAVENAWAGTTGYYKITATKSTSLSVYLLKNIDLDPEGDMEDRLDLNIPIVNIGISYHTLKHYVLSLRESRGLIVTAEYTLQLENPYTYDWEEETLWIFNPNNAKLTFSLDEEVSELQTEPQATKSGDKYTLTSKNTKLQAGNGVIDSDTIIEMVTNAAMGRPSVSDDIKGNHKFTVHVDIDSDSVPDYFPDKDIELKPNTIYNDDSESYSFMTGGGLSTTTIIIIVVVVVVVVVAIVILILAYCCHCCCFKKKKGGKSSSSSSSSSSKGKKV